MEIFIALVLFFNLGFMGWIGYETKKQEKDCEKKERIEITQEEKAQEEKEEILSKCN